MQVNFYKSRKALSLPTSVEIRYHRASGLVLRLEIISYYLLLMVFVSRWNIMSQTQSATSFYRGGKYPSGDKLVASITILIARCSVQVWDSLLLRLSQNLLISSLRWTYPMMFRIYEWIFCFFLKTLGYWSINP
jgi:hypothetical protein